MHRCRFEEAITWDDFLAAAQRGVGMGAQLVGACCGIGPEHIRLLREKLPGRVLPRGG